MKNFKEIAEKCLAGELSGTFVLRNGDKCLSSTFKKDQSLLTSFRYAEHFYYSDSGHCYTMTGHKSKFDVIDFIPDNMQKQITIDIPEGKVPVMEQTEKGVVITWKEKELTYNDICFEFINNSKFIHNYTRDTYVDRPSSQSFYKKVEVLRKLTNIRNYFGGDKPTNSWIITIDSALRPFVIKNPKPYRETCFIYFDTKEHAQAAINMLGDELQYLFKPW